MAKRAKKVSPEKRGLGDLWVGKRRPVKGETTNVRFRIICAVCTILAVPVCAILIELTNFLFVTAASDERPIERKITKEKTNSRPIIKAETRIQAVRANADNAYSGNRIVGTSGLWTTVIDGEGEDKTCYMTTQALYGDHKRVLRIEHSPGWKWFNQIKYFHGESLESNNIVRFEFGDDVLNLNAINGKNAWLKEGGEHVFFNLIKNKNPEQIEMRVDDQYFIFDIREFNTALAVIDSHCGITDGYVLARTRPDTEYRIDSWLVGKSSLSDVIRAKKLAVGSKTDWLWFINTAESCDKLDVLFTLGSFRGYHDPQKLKDKELRVLWGKTVKNAKIVGVKEAPSKRLSIAISIDGKPLAEILKSYNGGDSISMRLLDTDDIILDDYFETQKTIWKLEGLESALAEQQGICHKTAADNQSTNSEKVARQEAPQIQEKSGAETDGKELPLKGNVSATDTPPLWDVGRFNGNPKMFRAQIAGHLSKSGRLGFFNTIDNCKLLAMVFSISTNKVNSLESIKGKTLRVVWNDTVQDAKITGTQAHDNSSGALMFFGQLDIQAIRKFHGDETDVSMQLLDTDDVVVNHYFDQPKNNWSLLGMDDALAETVGLCYIAAARAETAKGKSPQEKSTPENKLRKPSKEKMSFNERSL
jgi:hypothetical protein